MPLSVPSPDRPLDLVGLGQNSVDHQIRLKQFPASGEKVEASRYQLLPGGQVATAVLAGQRLGLRCAYLGAVGDDHLASIACNSLEAAGVRVHLHRVSGGRSQMATILVTDDGDRTILQHYDERVILGAQDLVRYKDLIQGARALHLDITDLGAAVRAAAWARQAGVLVSLDIDRMLPGVEQLFPLVDLLLAADGFAGLIGRETVQHALEWLRHRCPGVVGITRGERGCLLWSPEEEAPCWYPAFAVDPVDTTGCGDVFRGAVLAALLRDPPVPDLAGAVRFGAAAAALQAGAEGAQPAVPDLKSVQSFLASEPRVRERL